MYCGKIFYGENSVSRENDSVSSLSLLITWRGQGDGTRRKTTPGKLGKPGGRTISDPRSVIFNWRPKPPGSLLLFVDRLTSSVMKHLNQAKKTVFCRILKVRWITSADGPCAAIVFPAKKSMKVKCQWLLFTTTSYVIKQFIVSCYYKLRLN